MSTTNENVGNELKVWQSDEAIGDDGRTYRRITLKSIIQDLLDVFLFNRGVLFTMKELTVNPGRAIRGYLDTERWKYTHPLKYLFVLVAVYLFVAIQLDVFNTEQVIISSGELDAQQIQQDLQAWMTDTFQLWMAFGVIFFALFSFLFFRKSGFNFTEHMVVNTYVYGHITLMYVIVMPINYVIGGNTLFIIGFAVFFVWNVWVYHKTFRMRWLQSLWRGVCALLLGYLLFMIFYLSFIILVVSWMAGEHS